jgi:phage baseplate assembly protein W
VAAQQNDADIQMSKKTYIGLSDLMTDLNLYVAASNAEPLDLSLLPLLAKLRYFWIVDNWKALYLRFKDIASGDTDLEASLEDFDASVKSSLLGSRANILENSDKFQLYSPFLRAVAVDEIGLTPSEQVSIDQEIQRIAELSIEDFRSMLAFVKGQAASASSAIGLGDATAERVLGASPSARVKGATIADMSLIDSVIQVSQFIEGIIYELKQSVDRPPNLLSLANSNIDSESEVSIQDIYRSYLPVPFEISLESMAQKYLGDRSLWFELVSVNNLQPPYVDEMGTKYPLLAPGASNNVLISANRKDDVHVGTKIMIGSYAIREESRIVEKMLFNSDGTMVLFLSGNQDLFKLATKEGAFVRIFKPHTVNTGSFIKIPLTANVAIPSNGITPDSDQLRRLDQALLNFGVDIAQSDMSGDIIVDANGNFAMAYGLKNVRQAVTNKLMTVIGEMPFHSDYGLDLNVGVRWAGAVDEAVAISEEVVRSIMTDPRFTSASVTDISATGTGLSLSLLVTIVGSDEKIPLAFAA